MTNWEKQIQWGQKFSGICCTVVRDQTQQVSFLCDNFCSFCNTYWWGMFGTICDQPADMGWKAPLCWDYQMDLNFAIHKAALLKYPQKIAIDVTLRYMTWRNIKNLNQLLHFWNPWDKGFQMVYRLSRSVDILEEAFIRI